MTTMIADATRRTSLGVGFDGSRNRVPNKDAWKQHMGSRPVPARLALLPEAKPNWNRVGFSAVLQLSLLTFFVLVPLLYPEGMKTAVHFYSTTPLAAPVTEVPVAPPPPPPPAVKPVKMPKAEVKPAPIEPPKLNPQQPHIFQSFVAPVVRPKEKLETKAPDVTPVFENTKIEIKDSGPKRPKEDIKVGNLNSGSAATPTLKPMPVEQVQTGGFGDPNGLPGKGDPNHATNVNRLGSPALPGGPGYGNGTGGDKGVRGVVPSTGFGNGTAIPPSGSGKKGTVASSGFGNATDTTAEAPKKKAGPTGPADTAPDILEKPRPEYTAEGRSMKIEGDVRLDVVFLANGTIQVNRVVSGLGHGLDEAAQRAAKQIKFKPAKKDGQSVDFPAVMRIEFRLAY